MRTDFLGEYDENEVPRDFHAPVRVDEKNDAIVGDDNFVMLRYAFTTETVPKGFARRRAEFLCRLANGEIYLCKGAVLRRAEEQWQQDRLVVTYLPIGQMTQEEYDRMAKTIIENSTKFPADVSANLSGGLTFPVETIPSNGGALDMPVGMTKTERKKHDTLMKRLGKFVAKMNEKYAEDGKSDG